ncbi:unnamed protein product [Prunus armeniaca]
MDISQLGKEDGIQNIACGRIQQLTALLNAALGYGDRINYRSNFWQWLITNNGILTGIFKQQVRPFCFEIAIHGVKVV